MEADKKHSVCPVERAAALDFAFRKLLQNPARILRPYIKEGMTVLDLGCGPGFFTLEMARLVGSSGNVIAADLQAGMLGIVREKMRNSDLAARVKYHHCPANRIGLPGKCDFVLVFYMLHEVPDQARFLAEIRSMLKLDGRVLLAEPRWHVTPKEFLIAVAVMEQAGFTVLERPKIRFSRAVVLGPAAAGA